MVILLHMIRKSGHPQGGLLRALVPLLGAALVLPAWEPAVAQDPGEVIHAIVLDVPTDLFECGGGFAACNLSYRIYHATGIVEINRPRSVLDGNPLQRTQDQAGFALARAEDRAQMTLRYSW